MATKAASGWSPPRGRAGGGIIDVPLSRVCKACGGAAGAWGLPAAVVMVSERVSWHDKACNAARRQGVRVAVRYRC